MYLSLIVLAVAVLPVPVIIRSIGRGQQPYRTVLEGIISAAVGAILLMVMASASGTSVFDSIMDSVRSMARIIASDPAVRQAAGASVSQSELYRMVTDFYEQSARLFPATICVLSAVASYVEYILLSKVIKQKPGNRPARPMDKFRDFCLPRNAGICWLGMVLLSWALMKADIAGMDLLYVNINALFNFVFCLQGISVLFMFVYKKGAPKALAVIIAALFLLSGIGKLALMILGLADLIFGLKAKMS
ncbi:MAG: DUF2232 domain-containing protein [Firmicutes bacterium]|nr:DUF2232 domain-containing protein [Bacillota bacterium]